MSSLPLKICLTSLPCRSYKATSAIPVSEGFEAELGRQILASEKERAGLQVLMGLGIFVTIAVISVIDIARGDTED